MRLNHLLRNDFIEQNRVSQTTVIHSGNSKPFMEPENALPCSQCLTTGAHPESDKAQPTYLVDRKRCVSLSLYYHVPKQVTWNIRSGSGLELDIFAQDYKHYRLQHLSTGSIFNPLVNSFFVLCPSGLSQYGNWLAPLFYYYYWNPG
jgi:hypothetical protein